MFLIAGCRSPQGYVEHADKAASVIIDEYHQKALGRKGAFFLERPSDLLRKRLMLAQGLQDIIDTNKVQSAAAAVSLPDPLPLSLMDALQIGARNSREYQTAKEDVFVTALDLDFARDSFRNSYAGLMSVAFSSSDESSGRSDTVKGEASTSITRTLQTGAKLSMKLAVDLVKLLTGEATSTFGLLGDATISIPLLRGAGHLVAAESLTQAERNVIYAIWTFEQFKKNYALTVITSYLSVLERMQKVQNAKDNYNRIGKAHKRARRMADAGRLGEIQVGQAKRDELAAWTRFISAQQTADATMDRFKVTLGLPVDARLRLDVSELERLSATVESKLKAEKAAGPAEEKKNLTETALKNRLDLKTVQWQVADAGRAVDVARNALRLGMKLTASASTSDRRTSGSDGGSSSGTDFDAKLNMDLPWERTSARNAYRKSLLSLDKASRALGSKVDEVKLNVRNVLRDIVEAKEAYRIQVKALELSRRQVRSTELFQEAGRANIRDLLEAQKDLILAQDALISALVSYHLTGLTLRKHLETLEIDETGLLKQ